MSLHASGFLPYHLEVAVEIGAVPTVRAALEPWRAEVRERGGWPEFPESLTGRLEGLPGVRRVDAEGPHSSMLIALRTARAASGTRASFAAVLGSGAIAEAIEAGLAAAGVDLQVVHRLPDTDSPLELSVRDAVGAHEGLILYPTSRGRYACATPVPAVPPAAVLCNRHSRSLAALVHAAHARAALVSHRPHRLGRHDRIEDHLALLRDVDQLVLSNRHGVLGRFARALGLEIPRGWPAGAKDVFPDDMLCALAERLLERMPEKATLLATRAGANDTVFFRRAEERLAIGAPEGHDRASRAARLQGALLGRTLRARVGGSEPWNALCRGVVADAFAGTETRPWRYVPATPGSAPAASRRD